MPEEKWALPEITFGRSSEVMDADFCRFQDSIFAAMEALGAKPMEFVPASAPPMTHATAEVAVTAAAVLVSQGADLVVIDSVGGKTMELFDPSKLPAIPLGDLIKKHRERSSLTLAQATAKIDGLSSTMGGEKLFQEWEEGKKIPGKKWLPRLMKMLTIPAIEMEASYAKATENKKPAKDPAS